MDDGSRKAGYELQDVRIGGIVKFATWLVIGTALSMLLMWALFRQFESRAVSADAAVVPATRVPLESRRQPPMPVLQGAPGSEFELDDPVIEMRAMREEEQAALDGWGWVDRDGGVVRIPIERAKERVLERGLAVRSRDGDTP